MDTFIIIIAQILYKYKLKAFEVEAKHVSLAMTKSHRVLSGLSWRGKLIYKLRLRQSGSLQLHRSSFFIQHSISFNSEVFAVRLSSPAEHCLSAAVQVVCSRVTECLPKNPLLV